MPKPAENIAVGGILNITDAVVMWMSEESEYSPTNFNSYHFSQVVWKSTTELGCAYKTCSGSLVGLPEGRRTISPTFVY